ncbi:MAG: hypothetical protein DU430_06135 [Candidatus Tokpelaia sp.]|nr:MAG: hypothetical protein DU430_06135 [Candidatus Tokpelaia sp.]KAA6405401.1 hypothetical protein DPQ22_04900 [Candidatus Tokpelaia sp.]
MKFFPFALSPAWRRAGHFVQDSLKHFCSFMQRGGKPLYLGHNAAPRQAGEKSGRKAAKQG